MEKQVREFLTGRFADGVLFDSTHRGQWSVQVSPTIVADVAQALRDEPDLRFDYLVDITAVDHLGGSRERDGRFEIIYTLLSLKHTWRMMIRARVSGEAPSVPTLSTLWNCADWLEREVWDMFGINFNGHPDLRKILTPDELEGNPLRKDFGLTYEEPQFSHNLGEIEIKPNNPNH